MSSLFNTVGCLLKLKCNQIFEIALNLLNEASLLFCNNCLAPCIYTKYMSAEHCCMLPSQLCFLDSSCSLLPSFAPEELLSSSVLLAAGAPVSSPRGVTTGYSHGWFLHLCSLPSLPFLILETPAHNFWLGTCQAWWEAACRLSRSLSPASEGERRKLWVSSSCGAWHQGWFFFFFCSQLQFSSCSAKEGHDTECVSCAFPLIEILCNPVWELVCYLKPLYQTWDIFLKCLGFSISILKFIHYFVVLCFFFF